jgi:hypothetical protein
MKKFPITPARSFRLLTLLLALLGVQSFAQSKYKDLKDDPNLENFKTGYAIYLDQDMFWPAYNQDRDYTMGLGFRFNGRRFDSKRKPLSWLLKQGMTGINRVIGLKKLNDSTYHTRTSFMFGNGSFTPDSLPTTDIVKGDRPYASVIFFSYQKSYMPPNHSYIISTQFSLGLLGTPVSKYFQKSVHYLYRKIAGTIEPYDPKGWDNQISNGVEPTLLYKISYGRPWVDRDKLNINFFAEGMAGYYTNASVSTPLRVGKLVSEWFTLVTNPLSDGNQNANGKSGFEWYLYATPRVRFVGYNALMQGQFRHNDYELKWDDLNHVIGEFDFGMAIGNSYSNKRHTGAWSCALNFSLRTASFKGPYSRYHHWGALYFTKAF